MRQIVNGLLLRDGQILLGRRSETRKAYPNLWSFPGGHIEPGETLIDALHRELTEEIGIVPVRSRFLTSLQDPKATPADPAIYHLFAVDHWDGTPSIQDQEHSSLCWFAIAEAVAIADLALNEYRAVLLGLQQAQSGGIASI